MLLSVFTGPVHVKLVALAPLYEANKDLNIIIPPTIEIEGDGMYGVSGVEITNEAFSQCKELKSIIFPQDMAELTIWESAFLGCKNLTEFKVPASVKKLNIGNYVFASGYNIYNIITNSGLNKFEISAEAPIDELSIGEGAFQCCRLTEFNVPARVKKLTIGKDAFKNSII